MKKEKNKTSQEQVTQEQEQVTGEEAKKEKSNKPKGSLNKGQAMLKAGLKREDIFAYTEYPDRHAFVTVDARKIIVEK